VREWSDAVRDDPLVVPPVVLSYEARDPRPRWGVHWGTPALLAMLLFCAVLGWAIRHFSADAPVPPTDGVRAILNGK